MAEWTMAKQDAAFPIGKTRLECIGVILCAVIMSIATFQVRGDHISQHCCSPSLQPA